MAAASGVGALRPYGRRLYRELEAGRTPAQLAMLLEACRIADRLQHLDQLLLARQGSWAQLRMPRRADDWLDDPDHDHISVELVVSVDTLLAESRQQAIVYRQLLLAVADGATAAAGATGKGAAPDGGTDELGRIRAERERAAAGGA